MEGLEDGMVISSIFQEVIRVRWERLLTAREALPHPSVSGAILYRLLAITF
jgi:hypothetical protein